MSIAGEPSPKQIQSFKESNAKINIWVGAVRSGKTYISLWRFITAVREGPHGSYVMIARTYRSFREYIIPELGRMLGEDFDHLKGLQEIVLYGKTIHLIGANDERAESKIRGATFAGAYVDEITIIPESVFKMLISRCAMDGAMIFGTTNPDSPFHWLNRDFLQNNADVKYWNFTLDDNPQLKPEDREYLKRQYTGLWYQRFIEGKWVQAENAIYDFFDQKRHVIDTAPSYTSPFFVGIDYGTANPCAFVLIGYDPDCFPNFWVADEYYFDSRTHQRQKTDAEYASDLQRFIMGKNVTAIYLDPSAVSFRMELQRQGIQNLYEAKNDVIDGIRFVGTMFNEGSTKILSHCKNLIKEFQSYVWDEKSAKLGIDKPKKENDHCFVAGTIVSTERGPVPIEKITPVDKVKTRSGFNKVISTFSHYEEVSKYYLLGKEIIGTKNHPFLTVNGWKNLSDLIQSDILFIEADACQKSSNSTGSGIDVIQNLKTLATEYILDVTNPSSERDMDIYIETFGNSTLEKYHPDTIFITKTEIPQTIFLAISNALMAESMSPFIKNIFQRLRKMKEENGATKYVLLPKNGMQVQRAMNGIKNTVKTLVSFPKGKKCVCNAKMTLRPQNCQTPSFVRISARQNGEEILALIMNQDNALFAESFSSSIGMQKPSFAQSLVHKSNIGRKIVYNLHVEGENEFFAEGILVHNCLDALRYALFTHLFAKAGRKLSAREIDKMYNESMGYNQNLPKYFQDPKDYF